MWPVSQRRLWQAPSALKDRVDVWAVEVSFLAYVGVPPNSARGKVEVAGFNKVRARPRYLIFKFHRA